MACKEISVIDPLREAMAIIDRAVTAYRNRGYSRTIATEQAALALDISPRRAKSLLYGETFKISKEETSAIKRAYLKHLDDEAASFANRLAAVIAERNQFSLEIE